MSKYLFLASLFSAICETKLLAQNSPIQLDRPDQTECPFIVPKHFVQLESGFSYERESTSNTNFCHPSTLWKFGVNDNFEIRVITEVLTQSKDENVQTGLNPVNLGFKTRLCDEHGLIPMISVIGHLTTASFGTSFLQTTDPAPAFRFTMQHTLSEKLTFAYNLGMSWDGENSSPTYLYTATSGISITERLGAYVEMYGFIPKNQKADHRFDCGFTCLLNDNLMLDLSGGLGITENAADQYLAFGISYRFKAIN